MEEENEKGKMGFCHRKASRRETRHSRNNPVYLMSPGTYGGPATINPFLLTRHASSHGPKDTRWHT